jgi:hypothetical protein
MVTETSQEDSKLCFLVVCRGIKARIIKKLKIVAAVDQE